MIGTDIEDALHAAQTVRHRIRDGRQARRVRVRQHRRHGTAEIDNLAAEGNPADVRKRPDFFSPGLHDQNGRNVPLLGVQEFELYGGDVGFRLHGGGWIDPAAFHARALPNRYDNARKQRGGAIRPLCVQALQYAASRLFQFHRHFVRPLRQGAVRHFQRSVDKVAFHYVGERGGNDARRHQRHAKNEHPRDARQHDGGLIRRKTQRAVQGPGQKSVQSAIHILPGARKKAFQPAGRYALRSRQVGQVPGQNQKRFEKRNQQHADDNNGQCRPYFSNAPRNKHQRGKRRDGSQHREGQCFPDSPRTPNRGDDPRQAPLSLVVDMLGHDNGVVYDDADSQHEREQGNGINRQIEQQHDGQRADPRSNESDDDPQGKPYFEKQRQRDKHQKKPQNAIPDKQPEPLRISLGLVVPDGNVHPVRQRGNNRVVQMSPDGFRHIHHLFVVGPIDLHEERRQALVPKNQVGILECVAHLRNIPETHDGAVLAGQHDNIFKVDLVVAAPHGLDAHGGVPRIDAASRKVERTATNCVGYVVERQAQRPQTRKRRLDRYFILSGPRRLDARHIGQGRQFVFDLIGQFLQRTLGRVARNNQANHAALIVHFPKLRTLGGGGKRRYLPDRSLHLVHDLPYIRAALQLDPDRRNPLGRQGLDRLDMLQRFDPLLDLDDNRLLYLLWLGARIDYGHFNGIKRNRRPGLPLQPAQRHKARRQNSKHSQVGGNAIARHKGNGSAGLPSVRIGSIHSLRSMRANTSVLRKWYAPARFRMQVPPSARPAGTVRPCGRRPRWSPDPESRPVRDPPPRSPVRRPGSPGPGA